mmetsp:Transcript_51856/g.86402  ORF Transcript_51856/g.86402 Transcript_51856/m.86402 type:complete len:255 (+) Transcript_51856:951-1715(+)
MCGSMRRRKAGSSSVGWLVAAMTSTCWWPVEMPSICARSSVRVPYIPLSGAECRARSAATASTSSRKITAGAHCRAISNRVWTVFSDLPTHMLRRTEGEMLKNVKSHSAAMAFARRVFPVPGGPDSSSPFGGGRARPKACGRRTVMRVPRTALLASSRPTMSVQRGPSAAFTTVPRISVQHCRSCSSRGRRGSSVALGRSICRRKSSSVGSGGTTRWTSSASMSSNARWTAPGASASQGTSHPFSGTAPVMSGR